VPPKKRLGNEKRGVLVGVAILVVLLAYLATCWLCIQIVVTKGALSPLSYEASSGSWAMSFLDYATPIEVCAVDYTQLHYERLGVAVSQRDADLIRRRLRLLPGEYIQIDSTYVAVLSYTSGRSETASRRLNDYLVGEFLQDKGVVGGEPGRPVGSSPGSAGNP
jgi:hypothetical protein